RAACRAQRETGVPLYVHLPGWQRRAHEVLDIVLDEYGVAPGAVVLCHMDPSGGDPGYQNSVADRGVWLEFDMVGMPFLYPGEGQSPAPHETARAVTGLIQRGHAGRLLLSHDVFLKGMLTRFGGNGFRYVPTLFVQRLTELGTDPRVAHDLLHRNPTRLFETAANA
ncbi:phosphotriesterase-related protein, partial [Actinomadura adrarensis]